MRLTSSNLLDPRKKLIDSRASQKRSFGFHQELKAARRSLNFDLSVVSPIRAIWRGHVTEVTYKRNLPQMVDGFGFESCSAPHSSTIIARPLVVDVDISWTEVAIPHEISLP